MVTGIVGKLYCLVVDRDGGRNEDFNLNYLKTTNYEVYTDESERDDRVKFLNDTLFKFIRESEFDSEDEYGAIPFDINQSYDYPLIPECLTEQLEDLEYRLETKTVDGVTTFTLVDLQTDSGVKLEGLNTVITRMSEVIKDL